MATTAKILAAVTPIGCRIGTDDPNYLAPYCRYTGNNNYCLILQLTVRKRRKRTGTTKRISQRRLAGTE